MRIPFSLLVLGATALAHGLDPFTKFLNDNGLTAFASLLPILNQSSIGHGLIEKLQSGGNYSVLIPNNQAVAEISANLSGDALATIFSYHIIEGDFIDSRNGLVSQNLPKVTVGRTLLNDPTLVQLEGNKSQVLVWGKDSAGQVQILNQANPTTVQKFTVFSEYGRYGIGIIDHPLVPPPVFSQAATRGGGTNASYKLDKLVALFNNTLTDYPDHLLRTATQFMDGVFLDGFTFFMPTNEALEDREAAEAVGRASLVASDHGTTPFLETM
ncbi:beta-ig-h3 fasciclin [Moniliophthora roreri]|nr:beta-ig-h3 fasciclin [Moniliophthora roreri]